MKISPIVVALLFGVALTQELDDGPCWIKSRKDIKHILKTELKKIDAPEQWIWNNVNGTNYVTNMKN